MNQRVDPAQLRKRMLLFYFAAGVNFLMAFWVWSVGAGQAPGGTLTLITLVFLAFAGLNYYMARRISKFLRQTPGSTPSASATTNKVNE
jgi:membrane protein implicated in regulation of membrane protease activity